MHVLVTGASGLLGSALETALTGQDHTVTPLRRGNARNGPTWDPAAGTIDAAALEGVDAVIHLAGESLTGRWTASKKRRIWNSRVDGTRLLASALAGLSTKPKVLVSVSGVNYYGDQGADCLREDSPPGAGFLPDLCQAWEAAADPAREAGVRTVHPRIGMVLSPEGGALAAMLPPFKFGLGGPFGNGRQYVSWIAIEDAVRAILFALENTGLAGPINLTTPNPVTNLKFTKTLARVLNRPAVFPVPRLAARLLLGEMSDNLLFPSLRVMPARLMAAGYGFRFPQLEDALRHALVRQDG